MHGSRGAPGLRLSQVSLWWCLIASLSLINVSSGLNDSEADQDLCKKINLDRQLEYLDEMIDSQVISSCTMEVHLLKKGGLSDYCYLRGLLYQFEGIIDKYFQFKRNTLFSNYTKELKKLYDDVIWECMLIDMAGPTACSSTESMTFVAILTKVKEVFTNSTHFLRKPVNETECINLYGCKEPEESSPGAFQCDCPSSIPPILPSTATQKSPSEMPAPPSSTDQPSPVHHTLNSTEQVNVSTTVNYQHKSSPQTLQSTETSSVTFTEVQTASVTKMETPTGRDSLNEKPEFPGSTTEYGQASTKFPSDNMELQHAVTESTKVKTTPQQASTESPLSSTKPSGVDSESSTFNMMTLGANSKTLFDNAVTLNKNTETPETNVENLASHGSTFTTATPLQEKSSAMEYDVSHTKGGTTWDKMPVESDLGWASSHSAFTKMRRSIATSEETSRKHLTSTHLPAHSSTAATSVSSAPVGLPLNVEERVNSESPIPVTWGELSKDSDHASSVFTLYFDKYGLSTRSTTDPLQLSTEHVPQAISKGFLHPANTAHDRSPLHRMKVIVPILSQEREDGFAGPRDSANMLPIIETEESNGDASRGHTQSSIYLYIVVACIGSSLLSLCGLLYYKHRYWKLRRQQQRERYDPDRPEARPLQSQYMMESDFL